MKRKLALLLAAVLSLSVLLAGCGGGDKGSSEKGAAQEMTIAIGEEGYGIDPVVAGDAVSNNMLQNMYRGWYHLDAEGKLLEGMSAGYEVNEDKTVYTFKIKEGAKWSDGESVKAQDFVTGMKHVLNPKVNASYVALYFYVAGAQAANTDYNDANLDKVGIKAIDEQTVEYTLTNTCDYFPQLTANGVYYPLREDKIEMDNAKWAFDPEKYVTNGPFKLESYTAKDRMVMAKNEHYYDAANVSLEKVTMRFIPEMDTQVMEFNNGGIDVADQPNADIGNTHPNADEMVKKNTIVNYYITMSQLDDTIQNQKVREAISYAVDRDAICQVLGADFNTPLYALIPNGINNPNTNQDYRTEGGDLAPKRDVEKAKQLLAEAGFPNGEGLPEISYATNEVQRHTDVATLVQQQLAEVGITMNVQTQEWGVFLDERMKGNYTLARHAMSADYLDPTTFLDMYKSDNTGQNEAKVKDAAYDKLIADAAVETDSAKRWELLHEAEKVLIQDGTYLVPLFSYKDPQLVKPYVQGMYTDPSGTIKLDNTKVIR